MPTQRPEVYASRWEHQGARLWTLVNRSTEPVEGRLLLVDTCAGQRYFDLTHGRELDPIEPEHGQVAAAWAGQRLPSEEEWQHAMETGAAAYGHPRVWNWTESEHSDGRTRFCILKGGATYQAPGSAWYFDGGPQPPHFRAKYLLMWPGLERCATIGFRCALDLSADTWPDLIVSAGVAGG